MESLQQPPQIALTDIGACAGQNLHHHRLGHRDRAVLGDQLGESDIDRASGGPVEFDPGGSVDQDHAPDRRSMSAGSASRAWAPRMARASSRLIGARRRIHLVSSLLVS
jgi:hypothetical protein